MKPQVACGGVTGIECPRPLRGVTGKYALRADRLLFCGKLPPNTTTEDLADVLASSLEDACGGDEQLWERLKPNRGTPIARARIFPALREQWASQFGARVRQLVFCFTPDGAPDEQLAGRWSGAADSGGCFPNLRRLCLHGGIEWGSRAINTLTVRSLVCLVVRSGRWLIFHYALFN